jgi:hypothetical protein
LLALSKSSSKKRSVSSAYYRLITPPSIICGRRLEIKLFEAAFITILVKTSATRLKSNGDKGSPYLSPFLGLK